jgi:hypothetical protein
MTATSNILPLFVGISLAGAFLTSIVGKKLKWLPDLMGSLTTLILLGLSLIAVRIVVRQLDGLYVGYCKSDGVFYCHLFNKLYGEIYL